MLQTIIVYIIILLAICGAIYYLRKKLRNLKKGQNCSSCSDCPLKEKCSKPIQDRNTTENGCCGG